MSKKLILLGVAAMMLVVGGVAPAAAGQAHLEAFVGYYEPGQAAFDNDMSFGVRFGGRPAERFGWQVSTGLFDLNGEQDRPLQGFVGDANLWVVDASFQWFPGGGNFAIFGGPGFTTIDIDREGTTTDISDDTFTIHIGASYLFQIGENFYIRPDLRFRDFQGDVYDKTDTEATVGFGWNF